MKQNKESKNIYDVVVCGGGIAGISAALSASRHGKKTLLIEKQYMLGGLATAGLVAIYLPLCDGLGNQVSFSNAEELLRLSISLGYENKYPENWLENRGEKNEKTKRFEVQYNAHLFSILVEKLLIENGVEILYGSCVTDVKKQGKRIYQLIVEGKTQKLVIEPYSVVDATGDCDISYLCGIPTSTFNQGNLLAAWYYSYGDKGCNLNYLGVADIPDEEKTDGDNVEKLTTKRFLGLDTKELSEMVILAHQAIYKDVLKKRENDLNLVPITIPTIPQIRMTRKLVGEHELSQTEEHKYFEDSIGMVSNWKKRGPVYEVPYRALYSKEVQNLICAGRCISTNETMWDIMRVIPCCAVTGQAAGTAASITNNFAEIDVKQLQMELVKDGVVLHEISE